MIVAKYYGKKAVTHVAAFLLSDGAKEMVSNVTGARAVGRCFIGVMTIKR